MCKLGKCDKKYSQKVMSCSIFNEFNAQFQEHFE